MLETNKRNNLENFDIFLGFILGKSWILVLNAGGSKDSWVQVLWRVPGISPIINQPNKWFIILQDIVDIRENKEYVNTGVSDENDCDQNVH